VPTETFASLLRPITAREPYWVGKERMVN